MFTVAYDLPTSCWVGLHSGPSSTTVDYEACIDSLAIMDRDGQTALKAVMLVVDPGDHVPNATTIDGDRDREREPHRSAAAQPTAQKPS